MSFVCFSFAVYSLKNTIFPLKFDLLPVHLAMCLCSCWPQWAQAAEGQHQESHSAWTALVRSAAAAVGSPGLCTDRLGCTKGRAARADQRPGLTSGRGLSLVPRPVQPLWPERPAEAAASGSTHPADNISGEKEEIYLFSAPRDGVLPLV